MILEVIVTVAQALCLITAFISNLRHDSQGEITGILWAIFFAVHDNARRRDR